MNTRRINLELSYLESQLDLSLVGFDMKYS